MIQYFLLSDVLSIAGIRTDALLLITGKNNLNQLIVIQCSSSFRFVT